MMEKKVVRLPKPMLNELMKYGGDAEIMVEGFVREHLKELKELF